MTRTEILKKFREQVSNGIPLVGGGAGTGITAKSAEAGGIDLLVIYNSGRFRMAGRGSLSGLLAYGDANEIVMDMAREVLPIVKHTPVLAGVNGTDPFRVMPQFLTQIKDAGFAGVQNFPTVGLIDGTFRADLEETGMGYGLEIDMIKIAHDLDLLTSPYVFDVDQAKDMARAGSDILCRPREPLVQKQHSLSRTPLSRFKNLPTLPNLSIPTSYVYAMAAPSPIPKMRNTFSITPMAS